MNPPHRRCFARAFASAGAAVLTLAACTSPTGGSSGQSPASPGPSAPPATGPIATARAPEEHISVVDSDAEQDGGGLATAASAAFFSSSEVAVIAGAGEGSAIRASAIGLALGIPTFSETSLQENSQSQSAADELTRLGASEVITVGIDDAPALAGLTTHPAPEGVADLAEFLGVSLTTIPAPSEQTSTETIAHLTPGEIPATTPSIGPSPDSTPEGSTGDPSATAHPGSSESAFSTYAPTEPVADTYAFAQADPAGLFAVATARAAGARVVATDDDPRVAAAEADGLESAEAVVGMGPGFQDQELLEWVIAVAASGQELPGGGSLVFHGTRYVALYGSLHARELGVLGQQQSLPETLERAGSRAAEYADLTEETVVPALEVIVTIASASAGADGNYSAELPPEDFTGLIEQAGEAGQYVVLDFQPGRTDFLTQVKAYSELLEYPHVGVALDPEWRLAPDQHHMVDIGSVSASEVNDTVDYLARFVRENGLPQKMVILHQFRTWMISDREDLRTTDPEVALLIHADGHGTPSQKLATWQALHENAPDVQWGWKNFTVEDSPMFTPAETYAIDPAPDFVSYQ